MALLTDKAPTVFRTEAAAIAAAILMVDVEAGETYVVLRDPAGTGKCIVKFHDANGHFIGEA